MRRSSVAGALATQIAPMVQGGAPSTRWPATTIDQEIASGSPPPSLSTNPGTVGKKAGNTTPDVLLYIETIPVISPMIPLIVFTVANLASKALKSSIPPVFSSRLVNTVTPQTMRITFQGMERTAATSSLARNNIRTTAPANAPIPTSTRKKITATNKAAITTIVAQCLNSSVPAALLFEDSESPAGSSGST